MTTWIDALMERLPDIINALAPGFLLLTFFSWTTSKKYGSGTTVVIISAVLSHIIERVSGGLYSPNSAASIVLVYTISALLGFVLALVYKSVWLGKFLSWIGVKRTANDSIWDDAIGKRAWIAVYDTKINIYYCGQFQYQKNESEREYVVIAAYYTADTKGNILENHTSDIERKLMINTADCKTIIISANDPFNHFDFIEKQEAQKHVQK